MLEVVLVNPEEESAFEGVCNSVFMLDEDSLPDRGGKVELLVVACLHGRHGV
jgi:hypothetical protein